MFRRHFVRGCSLRVHRDWRSRSMIARWMILPMLHGLGILPRSRIPWQENRAFYAGTGGRAPDAVFISRTMSQTDPMKRSGDE